MCPKIVFPESGVEIPKRAHHFSYESMLNLEFNKFLNKFNRN
jgi:hypothetical protein